MDEKAIEEVKEVTRDRVLSNQILLLTSSDEHDQLNLKQLLIDKINETSERRGHTKAVFGLKNTQINTLCKQCDLKITSTQRTTGSRAISCSSVYNAASTLVLWKAYATLGVNPRCLLNLDATSVLITLMDESWDERLANRGVIPIDLKVIDDKSSAQSSNGPAHKGCARIRWFPVMNACGDVDQLCLLSATHRWIKTKLMSMR